MEENIESNKEIDTKNNDKPRESSTSTGADKTDPKIRTNDLRKNIDQDQGKANKDNESIISNDISQVKKIASKPKKPEPIEKKPFGEFINNHLIPSLIEEFNERGFEIIDISLKNIPRPIANDKCWVIFCAIKDTCNFWLSFEKEDISSLKSISLSRPNQKPSVIESFLIDEKRITLNLIISRILQRLNGQKLIGVN